MNDSVDQTRHALVFPQDGRPQRFLAMYIDMVLNYRYGCQTHTAEVSQLAVFLKGFEGQIAAVFFIQDQPFSSTKVLGELSRNSQFPIFLVIPRALLEHHEALCKDLQGIHLCAWETAFSHDDAGIQGQLASALSKTDLSKIYKNLEKKDYKKVQLLIARRLKGMNTLPTLPTLVQKIIDLVNDPESTTAALEKLLVQDPAIVLKLYQIIKSPHYASQRKGKWTLNEIIVRLGLKKVGAIAMHIKMASSLQKPAESGFEIKRFWEHSVGTAMLAEQIYTRKLVPFKTKLEFNDYWIGALLHDIGKLFLGFFFWTWFKRLLDEKEKKGVGFHDAEVVAGEGVSHEHISQLLMLNANLGKELVLGAGRHHTLGDEPGELACLIHLANNLSKDLGMGFLPDEEGDYNKTVLQQLNITRGDVLKVKETLGDKAVSQVKEMVKQCT